MSELRAFQAAGGDGGGSMNRVTVAVILLLVGLSVFVTTIYDSFFGGEEAIYADPADDFVDPLADEQTDVDEDPSRAKTPFAVPMLAFDLLALHGSYAEASSATPDRNPMRAPPREFVASREQAEKGISTEPHAQHPGLTSLRDLNSPLTIPAAPGGSGSSDGATTETPSPNGPVTDGPPPARMHVRLVLVTDRTLRAVVDGRVVGVGDAVAAGVVIAITREGVEAQPIDGPPLFYEIDRPWPRGYVPPAENDIELSAELDEEAR